MRDALVAYVERQEWDLPDWISMFWHDSEREVRRIRTLMTRYVDVQLGFADAAVIAAAEVRQASVLTLDRRRFDVVAREGTFSILP